MMMKELSILITLTLGKQTRQRPLCDACLVHALLLQGSSSLRLRVAPRLRQLRRLVPLNAESAVVEVDPVALVVESAVTLFDVALVVESAVALFDVALVVESAVALVVEVGRVSCWTALLVSTLSCWTALLLLASTLSCWAFSIESRL